LERSEVEKQIQKTKILAGLKMELSGIGKVTDKLSM
jgi:hypothetical protein